MGRVIQDILLQRALPRLLRLYFFIPAIVLFIIVTGLVVGLPPGPLCDEGMVLFMEGGCDMGESNIFFFSKLGALLAVNFAFVVASRQPTVRADAFLPHLLLLCWLGWYCRSGGRCDTYYSHPNGSIGQMSLEIAAFAALGIALLPVARGRSLPTAFTALAAWNAVHVGAFYLWLQVADHWTWNHTWLVCATMLVVGGLGSTIGSLRLGAIAGGKTAVPSEAQEAPMSPPALLLFGFVLRPHSRWVVRLLGTLLVLAICPALRAFQIYTDLGIFVLNGSKHWIARAADTRDATRAKEFLGVVVSATQYGVNEAENQVLANYSPDEQARLFMLLAEIAPNENWRRKYLARSQAAALRKPDTRIGLQ